MYDTGKLKLVGILTGVFILLVIALFNAPGIVTIESDQGATLSIADGKDAAFKKAGTTKTTHFFFKKPTNFYASAEQDGKQTISSFKPKRFAHKTVRLSLNKTTTAQKISDGAVTNVIFKGNEGRGIVYGQNTVVDFRTDSESSNPNPQIANLPYVKKIVWYDFDNFTYLGAEGIGQFSGGVDKGDAEVGSSITGDASINSTDVSDTGTPIIRDISKTTNRPLVLLSNTNIFTSTNQGTRLNAITSFEKAGGQSSIFTSSDSIFKVTISDTNDQESHSKDALKPQILITKYSYNGEQVGSSTLDDDSEVINIVEKGSTTYVLTKAGIHIIENNNARGSDLYFANPADMALYKDKVVVLAKDGLWQLNDSDASFQLLYKFNDFGTGLKNSMSVTPENLLIFGTTTANSDSDKSATFSTSF